MEKLVMIRGGGETATGIASRLFQSGFKIIILEKEKPTVERHKVAFAQCVFSGIAEVEGIKAIRANTVEEAKVKVNNGMIPVLVDPEATTMKELRPDIVVDAIMAKVNTGTTKEFAPIVIGVGPGFIAEIDVHAVVESNRDHHNLGKVYYQGAAMPYTGIPCEILGFSKERVIRAPEEGSLKLLKVIGDMVKEGEIIGSVGDALVRAPISGVIRGLLNPGVYVTKGYKIGDIDPRGVKDYCFSISDKVRAIGGGVLEAILHLHYVKHK